MNAVRYMLVLSLLLGSSIASARSGKMRSKTVRRSRATLLRMLGAWMKTET